PNPFAEPKVFRQPGVKNDITRSNDNTLRRCAETPGLRRSKRGWIKPPADRTLVGRQVGISQHVRPQRHSCWSPAGSKRSAGRVGTAPLRRQKLARVITENPTRFPAAHNCVQSPAGISQE